MCVYLMGMHLMGMHLMGMHLMGMHLMGVYLMGVYLIPCLGENAFRFLSVKLLGEVREN